MPWVRCASGNVFLLKYVQSIKKIGREGTKQARKPRSYASSKLRPSDLLTGVKCRATSVAKKILDCSAPAADKKLSLISA